MLEYEMGAVMLSEYFVQFGIIIFPITAYQIWTFGKSFNQLPLRTFLMGIYGGLSAILCQMMPVHILGQVENFQCVPIILAILYGKRKAGLISIGILSAYQIIIVQDLQTLILSIAGILVYSSIPLAISNRINRFVPKKRFWIAQLLSVVMLFLELLFLVVACFILYGKDGWERVVHYSHFLSIACAIQIVIMGISFFLLESIIENGRIRKRQESLVKFNPIGIVSFDINNCFTSVNPAYEAITGYKESELLGKSRLYLWYEDDHDHAEGILDFVLQGEIKKDVEVTLRHKNGHQIPVRFTLIPKIDEESVIGYFAMVTDITESKAAEDFVRNSEKLSVIGQLAAGVAHEIRNPLTAIKGFLQLLFSSSSPTQKKYYEIMKSEISRIEGIVSEMLVLAKPQAASFRPVRLRERLEEVTYLLMSEANMKNVEIAIDYGKTIPLLMADENQLKQVFLNIGKNAIEAMEEGGKLTITMSHGEGQVIVRFEDNGHGIPKEIMQRIGDPFFTTKSNGTGLGFLISKRIVANHKGTMNIQSASGVGTTIEVVLPMLNAVNDAAIPQIASADRFLINNSL